MGAKNPRLRYHCVSVVAEGDACPEARALAGVRLLSAEAPHLPLDGCSCPAACRCTYRHYDDRRVGPRRAGERGELADPWSLTDRRRLLGRRSVDRATQNAA